MTALKILGALLGAAACLIPFLALTEEYELALAAEPREARVLSVEGEVVRYELHEPGSSWDDDGDGWIGPYSDDGVPAGARAALHPGDPLVVRRGQLELSLAPPTPLFLVGFAACLLLGAWFVASPILERRALAAAKADPMRVIELMVRKSRATKATGALLMLLMGAGLFVLPFLLPDTESLGARIFIGALGLVGLAVGVFTALGAWALRDPANAPVLRAIREEPQRIVWIYEYVLTVKGVPTYTLYVCRDDGTRYDFALGTLRADALVASLAQKLPHAVFGYSPDREKAWKASPGSFRAAAA